VMTSDITTLCFGFLKIVSHVIWKDWMVTKERESCFAFKEIRWSVNNTHLSSVLSSTYFYKL
jgi:hypothetical protein